MTPYGVNGTLRTPKVEKFRKKYIRFNYTAYFFLAVFSETLPYASGLPISTFFGAKISQKFCSHGNLYIKSEVPGGVVTTPLDLSSYTR